MVFKIKITIKFAFSSSFQIIQIKFSNLKQILTISSHLSKSSLFSLQNFEGKSKIRIQWSSLFVHKHDPSGAHLHPLRQFDDWKRFSTYVFSDIFTRLALEPKCDMAFVWFDSHMANGMCALTISTQTYHNKLTNKQKLRFDFFTDFGNVIFIWSSGNGVNSYIKVYQFGTIEKICKNSIK